MFRLRPVSAALLFCLSSWLYLCPPLFAQSSARGVLPRDVAGALPLLFEENQGQTLPAVKYLTRGANYILWLTADEVVWAFHGPPGERLQTDSAGRLSEPEPAHLVRLRFLNMSPEARLTADQMAAPAQTSYLKGPNPAKWQTGIANYRKVRYSGIYPGIDLVFYGNQRRLEYDFVVSPSADPSQIRLSFTGVESPRLGPEGELVLATPSGELRHRVPHVYQQVQGQRKEIGGRYRLLEDGAVGFEIDSYDPASTLIIDPVLVFSTYLGGSRGDVPGGIALDSEGNFYVAGSTGSLDFPLRGPFQEEFAGGGATNGDIFVTKINASGSSVIYSTYIGGEGTDIAKGIAVDSQGRAVITGTTFSDNFPFTAGSFQTVCSGLCPFVVRLSADGSELSYGTFMGRGDGGAIAVDSLNQAVITGRTNSDDFPIANAFQPGRGGKFDAYVSKLNETGTGLVFSTFLGGSDDENLIGRRDIAIDPSGNIYVTGRTRSDDFPVKNAVQGVFGGNEDAFVAKLTPAGALVHSTYLGGSDKDQGQGVDADAEGNAYVAGNTLSLDFPTLNALQPNFGGGVGNGDAFVAKIAPAGENLVYSTYLGGQSGDSANDIAIDELRRAVVVGKGSSNFPVRHALRDFDGIDNYVAKFSVDGSELVYSTPIGGGGGGGDDAVVTTAGTDVLVAGHTTAGKFPILDALQPRTNGDFEAFLVRISDAGTLYFAHFGNGAVEGVSLVSDLLLTGSSTETTSNATVTFRGDNGAPFPVNVVVTDNEGNSIPHEQVSELEVEVPPLGLVRITTDGVGDVTVGSATVDFDSPLGGVIRFTINPVGTAGVGASKLVRGFITPVKRSNINTGVAMFNPLDGNVSLTLGLRNLAGEQIPGGLSIRVMAAHEHLAKFIDELFVNADLTDFEGTLTVEVTSLNDLITATALELGALAGQFTTLPVTPLP